MRSLMCDSAQIKLPVHIERGVQQVTVHLYCDMGLSTVGSGVSLL